MRARDEGVLAESDAAAAVATEICHDGACLVRLAGAAALGGTGGRNLVLFARHVESVCLLWFMRRRVMISLWWGVGKEMRKELLGHGGR